MGGMLLTQTLSTNQRTQIIRGIKPLQKADSFSQLKFVSILKLDSFLDGMLECVPFFTSLVNTCRGKSCIVQAQSILVHSISGSRRKEGNCPRLFPSLPLSVILSLLSFPQATVFLLTSSLQSDCFPFSPERNSLLLYLPVTHRIELLRYVVAVRWDDHIQSYIDWYIASIRNERLCSRLL